MEPYFAIDDYGAIWMVLSDNGDGTLQVIKFADANLFNPADASTLRRLGPSAA